VRDGEGDTWRLSGLVGLVFETVMELPFLMWPPTNSLPPRLWLPRADGGSGDSGDTGRFWRALSEPCRPLGLKVKSERPGDRGWRLSEALSGLRVAPGLKLKSGRAGERRVRVPQPPGPSGPQEKSNCLWLDSMAERGRWLLAPQKATEAADGERDGKTKGGLGGGRGVRGEGCWLDRDELLL
jgi:hypothetical protein